MKPQNFGHNFECYCLRTQVWPEEETLIKISKEKLINRSAAPSSKGISVELFMPRLLPIRNTVTRLNSGSLYIHMLTVIRLNLSVAANFSMHISQQLIIIEVSICFL